MPSDSSNPKTLYVIDGLAQIFRAYHAIRTGLSSPVTKEPTNAVFGYVGMLIKVLREFKPDYLVVVTDVSGDRETFRSTLYPEYKAHRPPVPIDFKPQVVRCLSISREFNIPVLGVETFEADDVIATLATRLTQQHPDLRIRIVSKDKDLAQLLSDRVEMIDVHTGDRTTVESLKTDKGVTPAQVIDMLALMGDAVDNVPGIEGIGPKTAAELINTYSSIDNLLAHLSDLKGKRRENIEKGKDTLSLSRQLVTLRHDVPVEFDLESARVDVTRLNVPALQDRFRELGFNRFRDELAQLASGAPPSDPAGAAPSAPKSSPKSKSAQDDSPIGLFAGLAQPAPDVSANATALPPQERAHYDSITTRAQLDALITQLRTAPVISIDTETTDISPVKADLCGISLSLAPGSGCYIPLRSPDPSAHLSPDEVLSALRPILQDSARPKTGHNLKYDLIVFRKAGVPLAGVAFDSMVASYLIDSARPSHSLDNLAQALLNYRMIPITDLLGESRKGEHERTFDQVPIDQATQYSAEDADIALRLHDLFTPQLADLDLRKLFDDIEVPLVEVLAELEYNGITVNPAILDEQRAELARRIEELRKEISAAAPRPFNPDSPKQLAAVLFNKPEDPEPGLGLKVVRRNKTGPSTDIEVLEKLAGDPAVKTPVPTLIVEYRQLTKLVNTYLVALKEAINPGTGRIHASFNQTVAATGRLASSDPNLQNIPIRTDVGRRIRRAFIAPPGFKLITADYSQIELRLLAHLSEDEGLIAAFQHDEDIHTAVAAQIHNVALEAVTREMRSGAKMVNFGIIYGITAFGLARRLGEGVTNESASRIIADYKARYPGIDAFLEKCIEQARTHGFVETMFKRRRAIPQIHSRNPQERNFGERIAINSVVQGSAADLIKIAMVDLFRALPEKFPGVRMLLQIHDELVFEAPAAVAQPAADFIVARMEHAIALKVPLKVSAAVSENWDEAK